MSKDWLSRSAAPVLTFERLGRLSLEDIEDGLAQAHRELNRPISDDEAATIARDISARAEEAARTRSVSRDEFNVHINLAVKSYISALRQ